MNEMAKSRAFRCVLFVGGWVSVAGCGDGRTAAAATVVSFDTVAGIVYVRNSGVPERWQLVERRVLGSSVVEGQPADDEFGRITGVLGDAAGRTYVADANAVEVRVFDDAGVHVGRIGTEGAGPGEFRTPQSIGWLGDTLAVLDPGNARLGLFDRTGQWLGHRQYLALSGSGIRLHGTAPGELYMPFIGQVGERRGLVWVRQTPAGVADTLDADLLRAGAAATASELRERASRLAVVCTHSAGRGLSVYSADLAPRPLIVPAPGALRAAAWSAEYRIAFVDAAGDTVRVIERDVSRSPLSDAAWADEERRFEEFLDQFTDESCDPRSLPRPATPRMLLGIHFDDAGRTWIERETEAGRMFDVYSTDGRLLAELDAPARLDRVPPYTGHGRLYIVTTDSLDIEYVRVYDIVSG